MQDFPPSAPPLPSLPRFCRPLAAQTGGTLTGTVTDSSKAVIVGATMTATAESSGQSQTVTTNGAGLYRFPFITPGSYRVDFSMQGFGKRSDTQRLP